MKECSKCKENKALNEFYKRKRHNDGLTYLCKKCINENNLKFRRTINGLITKIYSTQISSSKDRGHKPPNYTKTEFKNWILNQIHFKTIYENWKNSGYLKNLRPSIDRLNDKLGYSFQNIELVTWEENNRRAYQRRKNCTTITKQNRAVVQLTKDGKFVNMFLSSKKALRETNILHITEVCKGQRKTAGGFIWEYKQ